MLAGAGITDVSSMLSQVWGASVGVLLGRAGGAATVLRRDRRTRPVRPAATARPRPPVRPRTQRCRDLRTRLCPRDRRPQDQRGARGRPVSSDRPRVRSRR
ncbi:hypothetical protein FAIPA1_50157 [Frankia sp. AiPs1]